MLFVKLNYPIGKVDEVTKFIAERGTKIVTLVSYSVQGDGLFSKTQIVHHIAADDDLKDAIQGNLTAFIVK